MKFIPATLLSLLSLAATDAIAAEPNKLICKSYGNIFFVPDADDSVFDIVEEERGVPTDGDTVTINFQKNTLEYVMDGALNQEVIKNIAPEVYLSSGSDVNGEYHGTYTFNPDYTMAAYNAEGDFFESFVCTADEGESKESNPRSL